MKSVSRRRTYRSRLRAQGAARTREQIVRAAIRLHSKGATSLGEVAREAEVSLSTVQKHFPTREDLFAACTTYDLAAGPDPAILFREAAAIQDPAERLRQMVRTLYGVHEAKLGYTWTSYRLAGDSAVLSALLRSVGSLIDRAADAILREWVVRVPPAEAQSGRGFTRSLLSPLTYRAMRLEGGLSPDQAVEETTRGLALRLGIQLPED